MGRGTNGRGGSVVWFITKLGFVAAGLRKHSGNRFVEGQMACSLLESP